MTIFNANMTFCDFTVFILNSTSVGLKNSTIGVAQ